MAKTARKSGPDLWEEVKREVTAGDKGGREGQWSARKAQLATQAYQSRGGGYEGGRSKDNSLQEWQDEDWGTKSGEPSTETGERYLPKAAREELSATKSTAAPPRRSGGTRKRAASSPASPRTSAKRRRATGTAAAKPRLSSTRRPSAGAFRGARP